jgi:hypothetical protein
LNGSPDAVALQVYDLQFCLYEFFTNSLNHLYTRNG